MAEKRQLFPGIETDFFRNRLTHSLEVAQISKSIAQKINSFKSTKFQIDEDVCECAGLAHDIGHPPFGHTGEKALDHCMAKHGGFEGNAQTLRILSKLEKKVPVEEDEVVITSDGTDNRKGLNLTYRVLASVIKYDFEIPDSLTDRKYIDLEGEYHDIEDHHDIRKYGVIWDTDKEEKAGELKLEKGYYKEESDLVKKIKDKVSGRREIEKFRTIECDLMNIADDISYSTYDLEDAFKAGFVEPIDLVFVSDEILRKIKSEMKGKITLDKIRYFLVHTFMGLFEPEFNKDKIDRGYKVEWNFGDIYNYIRKIYVGSQNIAANGDERINITSFLVDNFINAIRVNWDENNLPISNLFFSPKKYKDQIDVLKYYTYEELVGSPMMRIADYRGYEIVWDLFESLSSHPELLPSDYRILYECLDSDSKPRLIADFIAGMTDRYAIEFYGRLHSDDPESIFKPV